MARVVKVFLGLFLLAMGGASLWIAMQPYSLSSAARVAAGYYAKEVCSCRFVVGQDHAFCSQRTEQPIPHGEIRVDEAQKTVSAQAFGTDAVARFIDSQVGCRIDQ